MQQYGLLPEHLSSSGQNTRPTIGLIINTIYGTAMQKRWWGVMDAAKEVDVNLVTFVGGVLQAPQPDSMYANAIYELANSQNVAGLIIWSGSLDWYINHQELETFCQRYAPLPIVSVETPISGIPTIGMDNYQGMQALMQHLLEVHHHRRLAFICGPQGHQGAQVRYQAYVDALAAYGIPFVPELVVTGNFSRKAGEDAIATLIDQRHLSFDALVAVNDNMALGALEALRVRGISVPGEIAIAGFDNMGRGIPPLTTVDPPFYQMGQYALKTLLSILDGDPVLHPLTLPMELTVRQSCGCFSKHIQLAKVTSQIQDPVQAESPEQIRQQALEQLRQADLTSPELANNELLMNLFFNDIFADTSGRFLSALEESLLRIATTGGQVAHWQTGLSQLRQIVLPMLPKEIQTPAENLWQQARILIGEATQWVRDYEQEQADNMLLQLNGMQSHTTEQTLFTTFDLADLVEIAMRSFMRLGIHRGSIALYTHHSDLTEQARLVLAYDENGRIAPINNQTLFPTWQLIPPHLFSYPSVYSWVIAPLYSHTEHLGFVLFEVGPREGVIYETLRGQLSSALKGVLLIEQVQLTQVQLTQAHTELEQRVMARTAALQQEIAERKRTEAALRSSEATNRALLETIPDTIFEIDKDGFYRNFIPAEGFKNVLEPDEFLGMRPEDILPPDLARRINQSVKLALETGNIQFHEYPLTIGDETRYFEARFLVSGQDLVLGIVRDITERRQAEVEREQLIAELETKNAELEQFTYTVSHDLKSPLVTIRGFLGFLHRDVMAADTARIQSDISHIQDAAARMQRLLDDLLALSRVGRLTNPPQWIPFTTLVHEAINLVAAKIREHHVTIEIMPDLPDVFVDETRLVEVLQNLLDNAIKFMGDQPHPRIEIGANKADTATAFYVRDNGIGIKPQYHVKIFDLFERLHESIEGTGIGLALAKRIVETHNGRIWVESTSTQPGATFWFTLPATAVAPHSPSDTL